MEHGLAGIYKTSDPGRPIVVCSCGCIASGVHGAAWTVTEHGDGTADVTRSFDWPGHFHVYAVRTPVLAELPENYRACP